MAPMLPPSGRMEVVFSFDTTGSMSSCLDEVRGRLQDMVQRLQADIRGIRIAIFAHGDYCDAANYVTKYIDFTDNIADLCTFVKTVGATGGGDEDECYELVLYEVRTKLSWTPGSQKLLVMIGDANPHEPTYHMNTLKLNWREEVDNLAKELVRIYGVHCGSHTNGNFYKTISSKTSGCYLKLSEFQNIFDFIMAVCYREKGEEFLLMYEKEVRNRCDRTGMHKDTEAAFGMLRAASFSASEATVILPTKEKSRSKKLSKPTKLTKPTLNKYQSKERKITKARKSKPIRGERIKKTLPKTMPYLRRENVPETNFMLKDLNWSSWQLAIIPNLPMKCDSKWRKRLGDGNGFSRQLLFSGRLNVPALYEVAVQMKFRSKKFVVFSKFVKSCVDWEKKLVGKADISAQIDRVIKRNCKVYIRRVVLSRRQLQERVLLSNEKYDYAWNKIPGNRDQHRAVTKGAIQISDDGLVC